MNTELRMNRFIEAIGSNDPTNIYDVISQEPQRLGSFDNLFVKRCADENRADLLAKFIPLYKTFNMNLTCDQNTPLMIAIDRGHEDIVDILLSCQVVDPSYPDNAPLIAAIKKDRLDIVQLLMRDMRVNPSSNKSEALIIACHKGRLDIVDFLIADQRVDLEAEDGAPLTFASMKGHLDVIERLLLADVDVSLSDNAAIIWAGDSCNVSTDSNYPLAYAAANGYEQIVKLILTHRSLSITHQEYNEIRKQCRHRSRVSTVMKEFEYLIGFNADTSDEDCGDDQTTSLSEDSQYEDGDQSDQSDQSDQTDFTDGFTHKLEPTNPDLGLVQDFIDVLNKNRLKATSLTIEVKEEENVLTIKYL